MNRIKEFLSVTADQTLSTILWCFVIYSLVNGLLVLFEDPPEVIVFVTIIIVGSLLGALKYFTDGKLVNKSQNKDDMED
jgi:hypothetical protein